MDWNKYNELYPDRYINPSNFDVKIHQIVEFVSFFKKRIPLVILDVGGGVDGSIDLSQRNNHCYLLDPFVSNKPDNYIDCLSWDSNIKFDIIICRGAFNYLSETEIKEVINKLKDDGIFMFNTFIEPSNITRSYKKNGIILGIEETHFLRSKGIIKHKLMPNFGGIITHDIIYYPPDKINSLFEQCIVTLDKNKNSAYYIIQKKSKEKVLN